MEILGVVFLAVVTWFPFAACIYSKAVAASLVLDSIMQTQIAAMSMGCFSEKERCSFLKKIVHLPTVTDSDDLLSKPMQLQSFADIYFALSAEMCPVKLLTSFTVLQLCTFLIIVINASVFSNVL